MAWSMALLGYPFGHSMYWLSTLGNSSVNFGNAVAIDSSDNPYVVGGYSTTTAGLIAKYNGKYGGIEWQRVLNGVGESVAIDSSGNVYVLGVTRASGSDEYVIAKYDSAGTNEWQRTLSGAFDYYDYSVATDSTGNVYFCSTSSAGALFAKYDSSGTLQWQRTLGTTGQDFATYVATDSSGNVYVSGFTNAAGAGDFDLLLSKYDSGGTIQWQRTLGGTASDRGYSVATDSSGNVYVSGFTASAGAGSTDFLLAKYNSAGTLQWQRVLGSTRNESNRSVATDSSGNVYVCGNMSVQTATGLLDDDFMFAKYDSSGTIQWQRSLGGTGYDFGRSIATDSSGNVYVSGYTRSAGAGNYDSLLAKLPNDGSLTGTYVLNGGTIVYAATSHTPITSSLTSATSSISSSTSSQTSGAPAASTISSSYTEHFLGIG